MNGELEDFYEKAVHTDKSEIASLEDGTAAEFLVKMAALKCNVFLRFDSELFVIADTPLGQYRFVIDADGADLVVDQVL